MLVVDEGVLKVPVVIDACGRMDRKNAAKALGKEPQTLANWQVRGKGPRCFDVGGRAYYWAEEVLAFGRGEAQPLAA